MIERLVWTGLITFTLSLLVNESTAQVLKPTALPTQPSQQIAQLWRASAH